MISDVSTASWAQVRCGTCFITSAPQRTRQAARLSTALSPCRPSVLRSLARPPPRFFEWRAHGEHHESGGASKRSQRLTRSRVLSTIVAQGPVTSCAVAVPGTSGWGCVGTMPLAFSTTEPSRSRVSSSVA